MRRIGRGLAVAGALAFAAASATASEVHTIPIIDALPGTPALDGGVSAQVRGGRMVELAAGGVPYRFKPAASGP